MLTPLKCNIGRFNKIQKRKKYTFLVNAITFRFPKHHVTFLSVAFPSTPPLPAPLLILPCASSASSNKLLSFPSDCQSKQLAPSADLQKTTNVDVYLSPENTALVCVCVDVLPLLL